MWLNGTKRFKMSRSMGMLQLEKEKPLKQFEINAI